MKYALLGLGALMLAAATLPSSSDIRLRSFDVLAAPDRAAAPELVAHARAGGVGAALERLAAMISTDLRDGRAEHDGHALAHVIGASAVLGGTTAREAYAACVRSGRDIEGGCTHGVIEQHLLAGAALDRAAIPEMCERDFGTRELFGGPSDCPHGLGHAFAHLAADRWSALYLCDALQPDEREICYTGLFMEEVQRDIDAGRTRVRDPLDLCADLGERHAPSCYLTLGLPLAIHHARDWDAAFAACARLPDAERAACVRGVSGQVRGGAPTRAHLTESYGVCARQPERDHADCLFGLVGNPGIPSDLVLDICRQIGPGPVRDLCFERYGERLALEVRSPEAQRERCVRTGADNAPACIRGAARQYARGSVL